MSSSDACLAFGFDLGSLDSGLKIEETGPYGEINLPWFSSESDEYEDTAFDEALIKTLYSATPGADLSVNKYSFQHEREVLEHFKVRLVFYGDFQESPGHILTTKAFDVRGGVKSLDSFDMAFEEQEMKERLRAALDILGITPKQKEPCWLLASSRD